MIKGLRKSIKEKKSPHTSISSPINASKTTSTSSINSIPIAQANLLQSPKRVIKALYDYKPQGPGELEFQKGDFFHVIGNEDDPEWYEACNPSKNIRGMVPVPYFEVFGKTARVVSSQSFATQSSGAGASSMRKASADYSHRPGSSNSERSSASTNTLYAIVLYDFKAERSDELDIHTGENIILCAHHNYEWFIAKPIDRLGGPGLVPVSYVSVINLATGESTMNDVVDDIARAKLPTVDEWKSKNAKYKASSIPLGNVDEDEVPLQQQSQQQYQYQSGISRASSKMDRAASQRSTQHPPQQLIENLSLDIRVTDATPYVKSATVDSFNVDNGRYWFQVSAQLSNNESRFLCRYYEDFYDFQIHLLELFPNEAGRGSGTDNRRILPFIPGPLTYVTDKITKKRQADLNEYVQELIALPEYISHCNFVKSLFELRHDFDKVEIKKRRPSQQQQQQLPQQELQHATPAVNPYARESQDDHQYQSQHQHHKDVGESTLIKEESANTLTQSLNATVESVKLKFYHHDDIFALMIPTNITIDELRGKINHRIYDVDKALDFKIFVKNDSGDEIINDDDLALVLKNKLKILIDDE